MECNPAARVQGAGPLGTEGDPIGVVVESVSGCVPVEGCPGGDPVEVAIVSGGGGAVTIADCADVAQGCVNDASVIGDNPGTVNAHLRGVTSTISGIFGTLPSSLVLVGGRDIQTGLLAYGSIQAPFLSGDANRAWMVSPVTVDDGAHSTWQQMMTALGNPDGKLDAGITRLYTYSAPALFDGNAYNKERTPSVFRTVATAAAGNTALWTPAAGNRFRLMRYMVAVTADAIQAVAGLLTITLFDGAAGATGQVHSVFVPAAAVNTQGLYTSGWIDLGNGVRSAAINNVLNVNLSAALTGGVVRVIACGTEET